MIWQWMKAKCVWDKKMKLGQYRRYQPWDSLYTGKGLAYNFCIDNTAELAEDGHLGVNMLWTVELCLHCAHSITIFSRAAAGVAGLAW